MSVQVPVGGSQAVMRWSVAGDPEFMHVVLGIMDLTAPVDPEDVAARFTLALSGSLINAAANMANAYSSTTSLVSTRLASGWVQVETGTSTAGTRSVVELPNNCACLVRKNTGFGGRQNRGRMYFPPFMIDSSTVTPSGVIGATDVSNFQTRITDLFDELAANSLQPVLWHENGAAGTPITSFVVQSRIATQRTRMRH